MNMITKIDHINKTNISSIAYLIQNTNMLYNNQLYDILVNIKKTYVKFIMLCNSVNNLIERIIYYDDLYNNKELYLKTNDKNIEKDIYNSKDRIQGIIESLNIYMENINHIINSMKFLIKRFMINYNIEEFDDMFNIIKDYNINFSYDNIKDIDNGNLSQDINTYSCLYSMKNIYNDYTNFLNIYNH